MFNSNQTVLLFVSTVIVIVCCVILLFTRSQITTPVYCLMVTGYSDKRRPFALRSVSNFLEQQYQNKHLIILNQSKSKLLKKDHTFDNILEFYVNNEDKTLGNLRNISLQFVPPNAIWTTWDDDDWRHPSYLSTLMKRMYDTNTDFLMLCNRIEYNLNNNFAYKSTLKTGFMTFFSKYDENLRYDDVSTSEDVSVKEYATKNSRYATYDNDAILYIRLVHNDNTSVYVDGKKQDVRDTSKNKVYFETELDKKERDFVDNIISKYYINKNAI